MKFGMKSKLIFSLVAAALSNILTVSSIAIAGVRGGSSDGGGNDADHQLVDGLRCQGLEAMRGYQVFQAEMSFLQEQFPAFARQVEAAYKKKVWYCIPREFDQLPESQTGLHFQSGQFAYQNDDEIFFSLSSYENTIARFRNDPARADREIGFKLLHEAIMAAQSVRNAAHVRLIVGELMAENRKIPAVQERIYKAGFGLHITLLQTRLAEKAILQPYLKFLSGLLDFQNLCSDPHFVLSHYHTTSKASFDKLHFETLKRELRSRFDDQSTLTKEDLPVGGEVYKKDSGNISWMDYERMWYSPFGRADFFYGWKHFFSINHYLGDYAISQACKANRAEMGEFLCKNSFDLAKRDELESRSLSVLGVTLNQYLEKVVPLLRERWASRLAKVLALTMGDRTASPHALPNSDLAIFDEAIILKTRYSKLSHGQRAQLLCQGATELRAQIEADLQAMVK